jgi:predicted Fe-Mo cluster-binding NifX family protein
MVIAVSARGVDLEAAADSRFGAAPVFIIMDTDTGAVQVLVLRQAQGAGIRAAILAEQGVQAVLTGECGSNPFRILETAGIRVYTGTTDGTVGEIITRFQRGELRELLEDTHA